MKFRNLKFVTIVIVIIAFVIAPLSVYAKSIKIESKDITVETKDTPTSAIVVDERGLFSKEQISQIENAGKELEVYEDVKHIPTTNTGKVRRELQELVRTNFKYRRVVNKAINTDPIVYNRLCEAFLGGYTHANWIYADEVLFAAKINPLKVGSDITLEDCQRIVDSSKKIIEEAIKCGGTTIKSYTSSLGVTGRFQQNLMAHKRKNEECKNCSTIIKRIVVGGRSTYYCENCQK